MIRLGAFTERMADELAALRPLVVASSFDAAATVGATRRVSATLTAYLGLEQRLRTCDATAALAERVEVLRTTAKAMLGSSLSSSIADAQMQRDAAARLFVLLPEVLALSEAAKGVADNLGVQLPIATVPEGADQPVGSLAPLPTQTPPPTPGTVALPKLSVKIAGATAIRYYSIAGDHPVDLTRQMNKYGPRYCGLSHAVACVDLAPGIDWVTSSNPSTGSCTITSASISLKATVFMPRWTAPARVHPALLTWWRVVLDHLTWHEGQHVKIEKTYLAKMKSDLVGEPCSRGQRVINLWSRRADAAQDDFDTRDRSWQYPAYTGPGGFYGN